MRTWILSAGNSVTSTQRLGLLLQPWGVDVYSPLDLEINQDQIFLNGQRLEKPELIIPRFGLRTYDFGISVLKFFESENIKALNSSLSIASAHQKLHTQLLLKKNSIPVPPLLFHHAEKESSYQFKHFPAVLKLTVGSQGKGVQVLKSAEELHQALDTLRTLKADFYLEKYIEGQEFRAIMLGPKIIFSIQKNSLGLRKNLSLGAEAKLVDITPSEKSFLKAIQQITQLDFLAIDWIRANNQSYFLDVNAFPGLNKSYDFFPQDFNNQLKNYLDLLS